MLVTALVVMFQECLESLHLSVGRIRQCMPPVLGLFGNMQVFQQRQSQMHSIVAILRQAKWVFQLLLILQRTVDMTVTTLASLVMLAWLALPLIPF